MKLIKLKFTTQEAEDFVLWNALNEACVIQLSYAIEQVFSSYLVLLVIQNSDGLVEANFRKNIINTVNL